MFGLEDGVSTGTHIQAMRIRSAEWLGEVITEDITHALGNENPCGDGATAIDIGLLWFAVLVGALGGASGVMAFLDALARCAAAWGVDLPALGLRTKRVLGGLYAITIWLMGLATILAPLVALGVVAAREVSI